MNTKRRVSLAFIVAGVSLLIVIIISLFPGPLRNNTLLVLDRGSIYSIAKALKKNNAIYDERAFWVIAQAMKFSFNSNLKSGEYALEPHMSLAAIIRKMQAGDVLVRKIIIPEGYTTFQIMNLVKQNDSLTGDLRKIYNEGELLPDTYFYTYGDSKKQMLAKMHNAMNELLENLWQNRDKTLNLKHKQEALILASIVEKEAKIDEDRMKIASVFLNRLQKGMKLEADPTTIYAITKGERILERPLTRKDLNTESPFNTYFIKGLPPSPIANPGLKSLQAVLNPIKTQYLYFVVGDCRGGHNFAENNIKHLQNVAIYRKLKC